MAAPSSRQKRITGRVMHEFKHGELKSGRVAEAARSRAVVRPLPLPSKRPEHRNTKATGAIVATCGEPRAKRPKAVPGNRSARVSRILAPIESARAPKRWRGKMPANRRLADTRQRSAAPARLTDTPARNSTPRQKPARSRDARK